IIDLLKEHDASHIRLFGGGGGTIIPREVKELHDYGVAWIFTPEDGRKMGLQGMINRMIEMSDFLPPIDIEADEARLLQGENQAIARTISFIERETEEEEAKQTLLANIKKKTKGDIPVLGITGTGGAGKSSLTDEIIRRFLHETSNKRIAIVSIDPTKRKTGGALLGDRIRMNAIFSDRVYMRSLATRGSKTEISKATEDTVALLQASAFDLIIIETSGIGQGDAEITEIADLSMYVMTSEFGAPTQLEKIDMIDYADFIVINKFEQKGSEDAFSQVRKQYERSHMLFGKDQTKFPVFGTIASRFNDSGTNSLFAALIDKLNDVHGWDEDVSFKRRIVSSDHANIIPNDSVHYLREISATVRNYHKRAKEQSEIARKLYKLQGVEAILQEEATKN